MRALLPLRREPPAPERRPRGQTRASWWRTAASCDGSSLSRYLVCDSAFNQAVFLTDFLFLSADCICSQSLWPVLFGFKHFGPRPFASVARLTLISRYGRRQIASALPYSEKSRHVLTPTREGGTSALAVWRHLRPPPPLPFPGRSDANYISRHAPLRPAQRPSPPPRALHHGSCSPSAPLPPRRAALRKWLGGCGVKGGGGDVLTSGSRRSWRLRSREASEGVRRPPPCSAAWWRAGWWALPGPRARPSTCRGGPRPAGGPGWSCCRAAPRASPLPSAGLRSGLAPGRGGARRPRHGCPAARLARLAAAPRPQRRLRCRGWLPGGSCRALC